jgi:multiple antibiotic resistance protein
MLPRLCCSVNFIRLYKFSQSFFAVVSEIGCSFICSSVDYYKMSYAEAILALFAIVDPIGNIPILLHIAEHTPNGQSQKAFNTAVAVGVTILLVFSFAGNWVLNRIFHIQLADLQLAGGILLLIIAIDHLVFGSLRRSVMVEGTFSPYEIGCVPLACPLLAGPGAMVTSLTTLEKSGPAKAIVAIAVVFGALWLIMRFIEPIHKFLGKMVCTVFSKVMCLFIAAIGVHMIMSGLQYYFGTPQ